MLCQHWKYQPSVMYLFRNTKCELAKMKNTETCYKSILERRDKVIMELDHKLTEMQEMKMDKKRYSSLDWIHKFSCCRAKHIYIYSLQNSLCLSVRHIDTHVLYFSMVGIIRVVSELHLFNLWPSATLWLLNMYSIIGKTWFVKILLIVRHIPYVTKTNYSHFNFVLGRLRHNCDALKESCMLIKTYLW